MHGFEIVLVIIFLAVIITAFAERIDIPYPLLLVIAGLAIGIIPGVDTWYPNSSAVLGLSLPPILFAAARTISWHEVKTHLYYIVMLSLLLVLATAYIIAIVLQWLIPPLDFHTAFILGAIIAPTDTTAAVGILHKLHVSPKVIKVLEIESLFNDAIGIVLYKISVVGVFLQLFSSSNIFTAMIWETLGGIVIGLCFAGIVYFITKNFIKHSQNNLPIILGLILPYVCYLIADHVGVSGVLAVVIAGLYHKRCELLVTANTRITSTAVWNTLIYFVNAVIFILIGLQFPQALTNLIKTHGTFGLIIYPTFTILTLLLLRFLWLNLTAIIPTWLIKFTSSRRFFIGLSQSDTSIISWSGMRGIVSIALAIALPITVANGTPFPNRDLIIYLSLTTVLFTLVVQGLSLKAFIRWFNIKRTPRFKRDRATYLYLKFTKRALKSMGSNKSHFQDFPMGAKAIVRSYYAHRLLRYNVQVAPLTTKQTHTESAHTLLQLMLDEERHELANLRHRNKLNEETYQAVLRKLDLDEIGFVEYEEE